MRGGASRGRQRGGVQPAGWRPGTARSRGASRAAGGRWQVERVGGGLGFFLEEALEILTNRTREGPGASARRGLLRAVTSRYNREGHVVGVSRVDTRGLPAPAPLHGEGRPRGLACYVRLRRP